jgi:hypothetical protein
MCCKLTVLWVRIPESGQVSQFFAWSTILLAWIQGIIARSFSPTCWTYQELKRVNVDIPIWMVNKLDQEAKRVGVTRQSIIKIWLAERLERVYSKEA